MQENRKNYEQKITAKEKIEERRKMVYVLDLQGHGNQKIAKNLCVSLSTIEKDLHYMKYFCLKWSKDLLGANKKKTLLDSFNQIGIVQKELWNMYREEKSVLYKKRILDSIVSNSIKKDKLVRGHFLGKDFESQMEVIEKELFPEN